MSAGNETQGRRGGSGCRARQRVACVKRAQAWAVCGEEMRKANRHGGNRRGELAAKGRRRQCRRAAGRKVRAASQAAMPPGAATASGYGLIRHGMAWRGKGRGTRHGRRCMRAVYSMGNARRRRRRNQQQRAFATQQGASAVGMSCGMEVREMPRSRRAQRSGHVLRMNHLRHV